MRGNLIHSDAIKLIWQETQKIPLNIILPRNICYKTGDNYANKGKDVNKFIAGLYKIIINNIFFRKITYLWYNEK